MSRPLHNPYPFGNQNSTQRQNAHSTSGASSVTSDTSLGTVPSQHTFPASYTPPESRAITEEDMKRSTEMHIGQARKELRHQPVDQGPCFASTQIDKFISSTARVTSSPVCSSSQRRSDFKSGASSLNWPSYNESASLSFLNSGGSVFNASSERECDFQSIPGLGDYDYRLTDKPVVPSDSSYPKYTSQEAVNILLRFGLEKEDLEYLIAYPEDQITPDNLPFILRQIRMKKAENVKTTIHSKTCPEPQSPTSMTRMDRFSSLREEGRHQDTLSPVIKQIMKPSKVIDYGHTSKYTVGFGDEIGRSSGSRADSGGSGSMSLMDSYDDSTHNRELFQKSMTEVKSSALVSTRDQRGTVCSNSSMQSYVPSSSRNPTQQLQTQPSHESQEDISSFSRSKKDTVLRRPKSKPVALKESKPDCHLALKTKPPPNLVHGVHPDRPGLVLISSNDDSCTKDQNKSKGQGPKVSDHIGKQKTHPKQLQEELKKQTKQQQQAQKQTVMQMGTKQPTKLVHPALPQLIPKPEDFVKMPLPPSSKPCIANRDLSKRMPTLAMMQDYAAATPQTFPHTCSLCFQKCTCMKDWLLHQNTSLHLDNCKLLRKRYPQWDGKVLPLASASGTEKKPSPSTSGETSQHRRLKTRRESHSRSRSRSPRRHLGSDGRRPKRGSYSRSRSNSPRRYYCSDGRREKFGSGSQSPHGSRHTRRSRSRSFSPRYNHLASQNQSRSRSHERRRDEKQSVPKRSDGRPPRRRDDKRLPPSRSHKRLSSEERLFPQQKNLDSSTKRLAKHLLETPALQSLSKQSDLETMAKTLAPVLLAELAKMKSPLTSLSSSASASLSSSKKEKTTKSSEAKPRLQKSDASSFSKSKTIKSLASTAVKLQGILNTISYEDVSSALEHFGKTESLVLYRSKLEAKVNFVKEDDAQKLKKLTNINIKGIAVTVVREQDTVSKKPFLTFTKEQGKPQQKKTAKSRMSTKATVAVNSIKKPSSVPSVDKKLTTGKLFTKAKVLVSKAKGVSTKQISKTFKKGNITAKGAAKSVEEKKDASKEKGCNNSKSSGKQQDAGVSKERITLKRSESNAKISAVATKNTVKVDKFSKKTAEPIKGNATVTHAKVLDTQAQPASTVDKPQTQLEKLAAAGTVTKQNQKDTTAKGTNVTSKSATSEKKPNVETLQTPETEKKVQQSTVVSEDRAKVLEARNATASEVKNQVEFITVYGMEKHIKCTEKLKSVNTKVAEPMEVESSPQNKVKRCSDRKALMSKFFESQPPASTADISPPKAPADPHQTPQATVRSSETLFKESSQIFKSAVLEPGSTAQGQTPQQSPGSSTEVALELKQTAERVENINDQKGLLEKIQATDVSSKSTASVNKPNLKTFKTPKIDTKVQESAVMSEDEGKVPETKNMSVSEMTQQAELAKVDINTKEASHTEPLESGNTKVTEPTEVEHSNDKIPLLTQSSEGHTPTSTTETTLAVSLTKLLFDPPQTPQTTIKKTETLEDTEVQESGKVPENTTKVPETNNVSACETKQKADFVKFETKEAKHTEPLESGNTKVTEPTKLECTTGRTALLTQPNEGQIPSSVTGTIAAASPAKISPQKKTEDSEDTEVQESGSVEDDVEVHSETLESGNTQVAEPMEVEHSAEKKALTKSDDYQTPTSTAETTPDISLTTDPPQRPQTIVKKTETLEEVKESATVPENTAKALETRNATVSETRHEPKSTGAMESGNTKVAEPMEDQCTDNGGKLPWKRVLLTKSSESHPSNNTSETTLDVSLPKSSTDPLKTPQTTIKKPVSSQIQQSMTPDPESTTAQGQIQQQTAGDSAEPALEAKQGVKTIALQKDPVITVMTRKDSPSKTFSNISAVLTKVDASAKTEPKTAAEDKRQPTAAASSSIAFSNLTVGEKIEKLMRKDSLSYLKKSKTLPSKVLSITNLPEYHNSCYTEADVANLLSPFGFQYLDDDIYVIPQMRMAFAIMPSLKMAKNLIKASNEKSIILNGSTLCVEAILSPFPMNPLGFYSCLMKLVRYQMPDDGATIIFIKRISPSEAGVLREALKKIGSVKNYLPLLNKVFIEFESIYDADRLGVWYSLLKRGFDHKVCRIKMPRSECPSRPPRLAAKALPDSKDVAEGATIPTTNFGVPQGSASPFWVTMKTFPFLFPTVSPWFIIPDFRTVKRTKPQKKRPQDSLFPHVMLTGLPDGNYRHEDVAKLVWRYFPVHNCHTLNNSIIVLSLQRRAFVYFSSWSACTNFVQDHIKNPVCFRGRVLDVHFVLKDMHPGSSEEIKYRNLMKWSNAPVTELESLEERLLCVEISETSVDLIMTVIEIVASNAAFVRFLPLANRIYIEMAESSGVTEVLKTIASMNYLSTHVIWSKVRRIETLKSLKQHLQDSSDITVNLELDTINVSTKPPPLISGAHPPPSYKGAKTSQQASSTGSAQPAVSAGSAISKSLTAGQSAITTSDLGMKETCDKPGIEITMTSTVAPQTSQVVQKAKVTSADGRTVPAACSFTSLVKSVENVKVLPVVKAREPSLIQGTKTQHVDKKSPSSYNTTSRSELDEEMIQEKKTCRLGGEEQNLVVPPTAKQISPRSSKDPKSSSSSSISQTSVSSSLQSIEALAFPSQKRQTDKPESPEISSHTSSDFRTSSSKMASTTVVDVAVETHQLHREEAKPTESTVGKSDHKVSVESIITETKIETSLEIHSTAQGQELELTSQIQSLEMDFNNGILIQLKESTGKEWEKDDSDKYPEEEDYEDYQILDSIDDQIDEQIDEHEHQDGTETNLSDPAQEQWDSHQVFGSVTEEQSAIVKEDYQEAAANKDNVLDTSKNQTPRSKRGQRIQKQEEMQRSFKASKNTGRIPQDKKQPVEDQDHKDVSTDADGAEEETFEILDSIDDNTDDYVSSDPHLFDEENFNLEDFVTVDEIDDDTEDVAFSHQSSSSSDQNSISKREGQSLGVSLFGKQTSKTSCQDSKISASHFASLTSSSKPADVTVKGSLSSSVSKTSAISSSKFVEVHTSPGQKTQPSKLKSPVRASHISSSACRIQSLKTASAAVSDTSADTHKLYKEAKTTEYTVVKFAQKVSTKRTAAKTADSVSRQSPGPRKGQSLHDWDHQVVDSVTDEVKAGSEECSEIGVDAALQVLDRDTKDQVATVQEDSHLVEDEDSTEKKMVDENKIQVIENSDKRAVQDAAIKNEVSDRSRNQTLSAQERELKRKEKEEMLLEESCEDSKDAGQVTSDKNQSADDEAFEILDSADDDASSNTHLFDRQSFNLEDFVTVDEIADDVEEVAFDNQSTSSSQQNSRRETERQGSDVSSSVKQISTRSLKDSKSSATCSSAEGIALKTLDSESTQSPGPEQGQKFHGGTYKVLDSIEDEGSEECNEMEMNTSVKALDSVAEDQTATVQEATQMVEDEGSRLKQLSNAHDIQTADNSDKSIVEDPAHTNEVLDTGKNQTSRSKGNGRREKEKEEQIILAQTCKDSGQMTNIEDQSNTETSPDGTEQETFEILDSADDQVVSDIHLFDEQNFNLENFVTVDEIVDDTGDDQNSDVFSSAKQTTLRSSKDSESSLSAFPVHKMSAKGSSTQNVESESIQSPGAEQGHGLHEGSFQVLDSVKDDDKSCSENCSETGLDASLQVLDKNTQDQMTIIQEDKLLVRDESSTVKQLSEENLIQVVDNSVKYGIEHATVENKGLDISRNQPQKSSGDGSKGRDKEKLSEKSSKASKDAGQIPIDKDQPLEDGDNKANVTDVTEQEAFEIVDSTDDHTDDQVASDTHLFDEQNINFECFVTVDEIGGETEDTAFDHQRSSPFQQTTRWKRKRQSSDVSSSAKHFSTRSTKDSKSQAALASTSKPTEDSVKSTLPSSSTLVSQKKQRDSSEQTKFNTRPFASPRVGKTPFSSFPLSVKTRASPCHKAQLHKTGSPARSPHRLHRGCRTHSSKMASTADVKVSVKTQHSHREEENPTEITAAKADHEVSAESITADKKIETSQEMCPPVQGKHECKAQSLKFDFKYEGDGKGDDVGKYIEEEEEDGETYQIIDSVDDQTEEQLDEEGTHDNIAKAKSPGPEQCQKLHEEGYQSLDFIEDKSTIQDNKNQDIQGTTMDATEAFEILDSVDDLTEKDDDCQKLETLSQVSKGDTEATKEEEEAYEVIDSVEDEPTTTETELEADNKEKRTKKYYKAKRVDMVTRRSGPRTRTSKSEEKWKLPMKEDKTVKKYETRTKKNMIEKNKNIFKDTEEVIQVNFDEDQSIQETSTQERFDRIKSVRGNKEDKLARIEASKKPHGAETDNSNPAITVRSTSGRKEKRAKEISTKGKTSIRRLTATRYPQEWNLEKTAKNEDKRTPTKKSDALIKDLSEKEATSEILHPVKDDVKDDQPATLENTGLERPKKYIEKTFLDDTSELVTLDEVGADEGGEEGVLEGEEWNREITEDELQDFVTLDEIVEEEEEGKEVCLLSQGSQSVQHSNQETLANVKEAGDDENENGARKGVEKISRSAKRKHDDNTEEHGNFGRDEDKEKKAVTTRAGGRATKRTRQNPVRKSVRGKKGDTAHEIDDVEMGALPPASLQASSSLDKTLPAPSSDGTPDVQKTEEKAANQPSVETASAGEHSEAEFLMHVGRSRTDVKATGKRRRELIKPKAKRPRSQSPCVTDDLDPNTSLGEEHMVPKMGLFCNLCSIFYLDEQNAKDLHCRSQKHLENLKKHQQKLRSRPSRMSSRNLQGSDLD